MQTYPSSSNVNIFPLSKIRENHRTNNLFYEQNVSNIINQLMSPLINGFVIKAPDNISNWGTDEDESPLLLNIKGYYIELISPNITLEESSLYVTLNLKTSKSTGITEINGQDENNEFNGIILSNEPPSVSDFEDEEFSYNFYTIQVFDSNGNIIKSAFNIFDSNTLLINGIDGKCD